MYTHTHHTNTIVINSLKSIDNSKIVDNLGSDDVCVFITFVLNMLFIYG